MTMHSSVGHAHGKIILSGEHAVLYGSPALLAPINRFCRCHIEKNITASPKDLIFKFEGQTYHLSWNDVKANCRRIEASYQAYLNEKFLKQPICNTPLDFLSIALKKIADVFPELLNHTYVITVSSDITMKIGLGSSAAITIALLQAFIQLYQLTITETGFHQLARSIESYQHGQSSGMDIAACTLPQAIVFENQQAHEYPLADHLPFRFINTGMAEDTTGQAIAHAAKHWKNHYLGEFKQVTNSMLQALANQAYDQVHLDIRKNHRLLCALGVVPEPIQVYIHSLESQGFSAKICGSGSSTGQSAGLVLVFGPDNQRPLTLANGYHLEDFQLLSRHR